MRVIRKVKKSRGRPNFFEDCKLADNFLNQIRTDKLTNHADREDMIVKTPGIDHDPDREDMILKILAIDHDLFRGYLAG